jgi:hypothetical protein
VVSKLLNHSPRGVMGVTSIYNRYEYLDERREALERWAQRIRDIVSPPPENVVDPTLGCTADGLKPSGGRGLQPDQAGSAPAAAAALDCGAPWGGRV